MKAVCNGISETWGWFRPNELPGCFNVCTPLPVLKNEGSHHRKESQSFHSCPRLQEVKEHGSECASLWKWWWPGGWLCLAANKNDARVSRVSVLKWAKSSRKCSAARRKDSFQTDMTQWHPELRDLRFLRSELSQRSFWISRCTEKSKK